MNETFALHRGSSPLLISVPHDGRQIPDEIRARMTPAGQEIPDTDWHVARLYDFAGAIGASILVAHYSRFVVDLNRSASDEVLYPGQAVTGLCPQKTFAGDDIYQPGEEPGEAQKQERVRRYWMPYHTALSRELKALREQHGYALLWDAHSIPGEVPRLFEGRLPTLNFGTYDEQSCAPAIANPVFRAAKSSAFDAVLNGRFKGGNITRHYGDPENHIHAMQLEIAQRCYMDESTRQYDMGRAEQLRSFLRHALELFQNAAAQHFDQVARAPGASA